VLKLLSSTLLLALCRLVTGESLSIVLLVVLYPFVGIVVDVALYLFRDNIWTSPPKATSIPEEWLIDPDELLKYAKELPKVRLMRILTCWVFLPFLTFSEPDKLMLLEIIVVLSIGFFVSIIFDSAWLKFFRIKKRFSIDPECVLSSIEEGFEQSRDTDSTSPGSSAWVAAEIARESTVRSRFPE